MSYSDNVSLLVKSLGSASCKLAEPLSKHTTVRIGGPAQIFYEAKTVKELIKAAKLSIKHKIPITVLGAGSNVLISDKGIKGLVIKNLSGKIEVYDEMISHSNGTKKLKIKSRWKSDKSKGTFRGIEFKDLDYNESDKQIINVTMDSGVNLAFAINYLLDKGVTGLQWFAGIPGTIGGAIYNNIHGGTHFFSETIRSVKVLEKDGKVRDLSIEELGLGYDKSRFQKSGEIILQAELNLRKGDVSKARYVAEEWVKRKSVQPKNSCGCVFQNISDKDMRRLGYPTTSTGYIIEHVLKMTGFRVGDAEISKLHHNFIVNKGNATAKEYLSLMKEVYKRAKEKLGLKLRPEIVLLGFDKNEIKEFL